MLRPRVAFMLLIFAALGVAASYQPLKVSWQPVVIIAILAAWYVNGTAINDLADEHIDNVNLKGGYGRPLANQQTSRASLVRLYGASGVLGLALAVLLGWWAVAAVSVAITLSFMYSMPPIRISYRGLVAPLLLPLGYVALPFLLGLIASKGVLTTQVWLLFASLYISFSGRIILKDFRDIKGDRQFGKQTFIVRHGRRATCLTSGLLWLAGDILLIIALPNPALVVWAQIAMIGIAYSLYRLERAPSFDAEQVIITAMTYIATGMLIVILATLQIKLRPLSFIKEATVLSVIGVAFFGLYVEMIAQATTLTIRPKKVV